MIWAWAWLSWDRVVALFMRLRKKFRSRGGAVVAMALQIICFSTVLISLKTIYFSPRNFHKYFTGKSYCKNCINATQKNQNRGVKLN